MRWNVSCGSSLTRSRMKGNNNSSSFVWRREVEGVNHCDIMQTLLCNCFMFGLRCLLNVYRGHWVMWACSNLFLLIIWAHLHTLFLLTSSPSFSTSLSEEECHCFCPEKCVCCSLCFPQMRRDSSDKAVILLNNAKFVQFVFWGPTLFVWPLKEEFSAPCLPRRERLFFLSCFIDTGGSGSLQCVWQCFCRENIDTSVMWY